MARTLTCNQGNRVSAEPCISQMTECPFLRYSTEHQFLMHPLKHPIKIQVSLHIMVQNVLALNQARALEISFYCSKYTAVHVYNSNLIHFT